MVSDKNIITVLMATYNDSKFITSSVKSILNQTYKEFEFLIIDDGSKDNTDEIINKFKDSRIVYKKISHIGLAGALNFGLVNSSGEWIARIDADDLNTQNRLESQLRYIHNPEYDVIGSWSAYFNEKNKIQFILKPPTDDNDIRKFLDLHNPINHSSVLFNKKKILSEKGYNSSFESYEDFELWFRLKNKLKFKILPEVLVYTRQRSDSLTQTSGKEEIYKLLHGNAEEMYSKTDSENMKAYWINILFWIEYFYGSKLNSRKYFTKNITIKKSLAYINTFLTEDMFSKILALRLRHRMQLKYDEKKYYQEELKELLMV